MSANLNKFITSSFLCSNFIGTEGELNTLMENEMYEVNKTLQKIKNKRNVQTIEEEAREIKKKFNREQNLYEEYEPSKFDEKVKVDLLFYEHILSTYPHQFDNVEKFIGNYYKTIKELYEMINIRPEISKKIKSNILTESVKNQKLFFNKLISEHVKKNFYNKSSSKRQEDYLVESKALATALMENGVESDVAINHAVKSCIMESLIRDIALPHSIRCRIKYLCEDEDYGKVFDQDRLCEKWNKFNQQTQDIANVLAICI